MDLLDFEGQDLYFDEPLADEVEGLIKQAADEYGNMEAELLLLRAFLFAPEHLVVLVALYRYYYYQHRYDEALAVADRAMAVSGDRLRFSGEWQRLSLNDMGRGVIQSMGLLRFYLLTLKAAGYLKLRLGGIEEGSAMLKKVIELDPHDRLGAQALLEVAGAVDEDEPRLVIAV